MLGYHVIVNVEENWYQLLGWMVKGKFQPACYEWFVKKLKKNCALFGKTGKLGTHSFRHAGAATLAMLGVTLPEISTREDWKSLCVLRYINRPFKNLIVEEKRWSREFCDVICLGFLCNLWFSDILSYCVFCFVLYFLWMLGWGFLSQLARYSSPLDCHVIITMLIMLPSYYVVLLRGYYY